MHKANRGEVVNELGEHLAITKESELGVVLEVTGVDAEQAGRARRRIDDERSTVIGEAELPPGRRQWLARNTSAEMRNRGTRRSQLIGTEAVVSSRSVVKDVRAREGRAQVLLFGREALGEARRREAVVGERVGGESESEPPRDADGCRRARPGARAHVGLQRVRSVRAPPRTSDAVRHRETAS